MIDKPDWGDKRSNRQREQHKLWQKCGTLHRLVANLTNLMEDQDTKLLPHEFAALNNAANVLIGMLEVNGRNMKTIKERIKND